MTGLLPLRNVRRRLLATLAVGGLAVCAGCIAPRLQPVNLGEPGWTVRQTPAVWHPPSPAPELPGELLVAVHTDGRRFVQFSKQSLPIVTALAGPSGWSLGSPFRPRPVGARGQPTDRVPWFQFAALPPSPPVSPRWRLGKTAGVAWRLEAVKGGEWVEGLAP